MLVHVPPQSDCRAISIVVELLNTIDQEITLLIHPLAISEHQVHQFISNLLVYISNNSLGDPFSGIFLDTVFV